MEIVFLNKKGTQAMEQITLENVLENKIHLDTTVKIGDYDLKFKATGYHTDNVSDFSVIIYDRVYDLQGSAAADGYKWSFVSEHTLPEDLATIIGREIEKLAATNTARRA
ncbi:MAG: hypothetical protein QM642_06430 [Edaphocola sp.]